MTDNILFRLAASKDIPIILELYGTVSVSNYIPEIFKRGKESFEKKGGMFSVPDYSALEYLLQNGFVLLAIWCDVVVGCFSCYTIDISDDLLRTKHTSVFLHSMKSIKGIGDTPLYLSEKKVIHEALVSITKYGKRIFWGGDVLVSPKFRGKRIGYLMEIEAYSILYYDYNCLFFLDEICDILTIKKNKELLVDEDGIVSMENVSSKKLHRDSMGVIEVGQKSVLYKTFFAEDEWELEIARSVWLFDINKKILCENHK